MKYLKSPWKINESLDIENCMDIKNLLQDILDDYEVVSYDENAEIPEGDVTSQEVNRYWRFTEGFPEQTFLPEDLLKNEKSKRLKKSINNIFGIYNLSKTACQEIYDKLIKLKDNIESLILANVEIDWRREPTFHNDRFYVYILIHNVPGKRNEGINNKSYKYSEVPFAVAHHLGNPIDAVDQFIQLAKKYIDRNDLKNAKECLESADKAIEDAKQVVDDFRKGNIKFS